MVTWGQAVQDKLYKHFSEWGGGGGGGGGGALKHSSSSHQVMKCGVIILRLEIDFLFRQAKDDHIGV